VEVRDGVARRADGTLAGSVGTMLDAVRRLHALGTPLVDAVAAATSVPARVLARTDVGMLTVGGAADIVVLDDSLELRTVVVGGRAL
jgi:N-acetylglucosamine-6-phosphate deacetylase